MLQLCYKGRILVENNICFNNGGSGIHSYSSENVDIINNTVYNNSLHPELNYGQLFASESKNVRILNNIAYASNGKKANSNSSNINVIYDYNIWYNHSQIDVIGENDIIADPMFVDTAKNDFRLRAGSPAIDSGTTQLYAQTDFAGLQRPIGSNVDRGAYEFIPQTASEPETPTIPGTGDNGNSGDNSISNNSGSIDGKLIPVKENHFGKIDIPYELLKQKSKLDVLAVESIEGYIIKIPSEYFFDKKIQDKILINTPIAKILIPHNLFKDNVNNSSNKVEIIIKPSLVSFKNTDLNNKVAVRPVVEYNLMINGNDVQKEKIKSSITLSIPYVPESNEKNDLRYINIWFIDDDEKVNVIPSGMYNAKTSMISFEAKTNGRYAVVYDIKTFEDINRHQEAKDQIQFLASKGIIFGTSARTFSPDKEITRGDFIVLLARALDLNTVVSSNFDDVLPGDYYYQAIGIAKQLGIAKGTGPNKFDPKKPITKQDMSVFAERALKSVRINISTFGENKLNSFELYDVSDYAKQSLEFLMQTGIFLNNDSSFKAFENSTRAYAADMVYRIYTFIYINKD